MFIQYDYSTESQFVFGHNESGILFGYVLIYLVNAHAHAHAYGMCICWLAGLFEENQSFFFTMHTAWACVCAPYNTWLCGSIRIGDKVESSVR